MSTCLLVRHGRTTSNASGTLAGWTPGVDLDDHGRDQVGALAERLAALPVAAIVTSPLLRCRHTTEILRSALPDPAPEIVEDEGLAECRYGAWTGGSLKDLAQEPLWKVVQQQPSAARFPDGEEFAGESIGEMSARAVATVRRIDAAVEAEHGPRALWLAVSHGDVIKAILADAAGSHLDQFQRIVVAPASLSVVRYTSGRPFLVRSNDAGSDLAGIVPPEPPPASGSDENGGDGKPDDAPGAGGGASGDAAVGGGS